MLCIRHTLSLKAYPCDGRPRGKTQYVLSAILKSSHSLSLHGYFIRQILIRRVLLTWHLSPVRSIELATRLTLRLLRKTHPDLSIASHSALSSAASHPHAQLTGFSFDHLNLRLF